MTNEQLTQEIMALESRQSKSEAEHEKFELIIKQLQEDVKTTKNLAEDVHIMAINMQNMQVTLEETNQKVDDLTSKEFREFKENKKMIKSNIISAIVGSICTLGIGIVTWILREFLNKGG